MADPELRYEPDDDGLADSALCRDHVNEALDDDASPVVDTGLPRATHAVVGGRVEEEERVEERERDRGFDEV